MSRTIAVHVRYKSLYISLPSSAQQQREMAAYCWFIYLELDASIEQVVRLMDALNRPGQSL